MTVKELIAKLQSMDQDATVVMIEYAGTEYLIEQSNVVEFHKGDIIPVDTDDCHIGFEQSNVDSVDDNGECSNGIVYIG